MSLHPWLLIAAASALAYGAAYCWHEGQNWPRTVLKTAAVALLALAGGQLGAPWLVIVGLAFGALGDFFLSRHGASAFLAGMAAFAVGHLAYAAYFWGIGGATFGPLTLVLILLAASTELWLAPHTGALLWPVRGYVSVILLMALAAIGQSQLLLSLGAGLFVVSDTLLALVLFVPRIAPWRKIFAIMLWASYWLGQFLILQGALAVKLTA
jgi:uncharacterized membrane protein YhhN